VPAISCLPKPTVGKNFIFLRSLYASDHIPHIVAADSSSDLNEIEHFLMKVYYFVSLYVCVCVWCVCGVCVCVCVPAIVVLQNVFVGEMKDVFHFKIFFLSSIYASDHVPHIVATDSSNNMK
jgi:hypothetical protein